MKSSVHEAHLVTENFCEHTISHSKRRQASRASETKNPNNRARKDLIYLVKSVLSSEHRNAEDKAGDKGE